MSENKFINITCAEVDFNSGCSRRFLVTRWMARKNINEPWIMAKVGMVQVPKTKSNNRTNSFTIPLGFLGSVKSFDRVS